MFYYILYLLYINLLYIKSLLSPLVQFVWIEVLHYTVFSVIHQIVKGHLHVHCLSPFNRNVCDFSDKYG